MLAVLLLLHAVILLLQKHLVRSDLLLQFSYLLRLALMVILGCLLRHQLL